MRFQSPEWLWALAVLPFAYAAIAAGERQRASRFASFADPVLWKFLAPEYDPGARLRKARVWILALAFAFLAISRPQWGSREEVTRVSGLDVMVVLDVSSSMEVEDVPPGRLRKAKHFLKSLLERMGGDRVGVVAFAGSAYVASPLTTDLHYVSEVIEQLSPRSVQSQGTSLALGIETARKSLERGAEEAQDPATKQQTSSQIVVLVSDGEDHEDGAIQAAETLRNLGVRFYVFGIGTERGGPIPLREENGNLVGYKKDLSGKALISAFHPDALMKVASTGSGKYWNITPSESELDELLSEMKGMDRADREERRTVVYQERFQWPLSIAVLLILLELSIALRRGARPKGGALAAVALLSVLGAGGTGCGTRADSYFENEKGIEAFSKDQVEEAKRSFGNAQAKQPDSAELKFNQGAVQLRQADSEGAARSFLDAMTGAARAGNPDLAGKSAFNAADAMTKKGDTASALSLYAAAIEYAKRAGNPQLEEDARKNLELLVRQQEQQKNQKQQDQQQSQEQQDKEKQQQQQEQQQKDKEQDQEDRSKNQEQKQNKKYQQNQKQKFRSLKLSDEDAERVMAELKERERELQNRLRKQGGKPQNGNAQKDW